MEFLIFIFIVAAIIWGIVKKYAEEERTRKKHPTPTWRPPAPRTTRRPQQPRSVLDELRRRRERENRGIYDPLKDKQETTKHIPIEMPDDDAEKARPVPLPGKDRGTKHPPTTRKATRKPIQPIRDPWEPTEEKKEEPPERPRRQAPVRIEVPRAIPVKSAATKPHSRRVAALKKLSGTDARAVLAAYEKQIGGAVWDVHVNRLMQSHIEPGEELLATVRGTDNAVLAVTDRKLMRITPNSAMTAFDESDLDVHTWDLADVTRIELTPDWLRCTLTIVTDTDPAPPENTFTYQRLYHDKVEALVAMINERLQG